MGSLFLPHIQDGMNQSPLYRFIVKVKWDNGLWEILCKYFYAYLFSKYLLTPSKNDSGGTVLGSSVAFALVQLTLVELIACCPVPGSEPLWVGGHLLFTLVYSSCSGDIAVWVNEWMNEWMAFQVERETDANQWRCYGTRHIQGTVSSLMVELRAWWGSVQ